MKNQYIVIVLLISLSVLACGNDADDVAVDEQAVVIHSGVSELIAENIEEIVEAPADGIVEINVVEQEVLSENEPEPTIQPLVESPTKTPGDKIIEVKEEINLVVVRADHSTWDGLTKKYVASTGKVNYKSMKTNLSKIKAYLKHLEKTSPKKDWSKNEKLAYWINLYNASTVYLVVSNYPTTSITKLSGGKPWDKKFIKSGTKTYSLNDIENNIVRPQFKDPRIHAALNCAAVSCPKLLNEAYMPSKLNAQLEKQTFAWINDKTKNKLNGSKAQLSQIFDWYKVDFKARGGVIAFINNYIMTSVALAPKAKISYLEYDWALNE